MAQVMRLPDRRQPWRAPAAALVLASGALAVALLVPRLFSDPVGVDPFVLRLSAVAGGLAVVSLVWRRLVTVRSVLLAVAAATAAFSVFAGGPQWIVDVASNRFDGNAQVLMASAAAALLTLAVAVAAVRWSRADVRPVLRVRSFRLPAIAVAVGGSIAFLLLMLLLPATLLGREGIAPVALARDLPLALPADALQAFAQELQFRGMLLGALDRVAPPWAANLAQAVFFGLAHIAVQYQGPSGAFVPVTIALGLVLGWITQRTGSLWPAIVIHAVADIAVTLAVIPGLYGY